MAKLDVEFTSNPPVKSFKEVEEESGRHRSQIDLQITLGKIDHTFLFANEKLKYKGFKMIVDNDKLRDFIANCKERDNGNGK